MSLLTLIDTASSTDTLSELSEEALLFGRAALSEITMRAYRSGGRDFEDWRALRDRPSLPASPATVANFASQLAAAGRLAAIRFYHRGARLEFSTLNFRFQ